MKKIMFCFAVLLLFASCSTSKGITDEQRNRVDKEYNEFKKNLD